jgi:3-dehydroquinate synthase
MGEVAKYAVLDEKIFDFIDSGKNDIIELVYLCVDYKRRIVEEDEFEGGKRKLLNLGHTPAHGIELLSNYAVPHGNAVAQGLTVILNASFKHGLIDEKTLSKANEVIKKCVGETPLAYDLKDICAAALTDKKRSGDYINIVMAHGIGDCRAVKIKVDELWGYLS